MFKPCFAESWYLVAFPLSPTLVLHPGINLLSLPENDLKNIFLKNFYNPIRIPPPIYFNSLSISKFFCNFNLKI